MILNASDDVTPTLLNRSLWAAGCPVGAVWLLCTYILLGQANVDSGIMPAVAIWAGFQFLWLICSLTVHHFTPSATPRDYHLIPTPVYWEGLNASSKTKILHLTLALSRLQTYDHPRGRYSYEKEDLTAPLLTSAFRKTRFSLAHSLGLKEATARGLCLSKDPLKVGIVAVIGDTTLASAAWMLGSKLTGIDLYNSCIVILKFGQSHFTIPAARVLSEQYKLPPCDEESIPEPRFIPRAANNHGWQGLTWHYWIPAGSGH